MIEYYLRPAYQRVFVTPVLNILIKCNISPLTITFIGLVLGLMTPLALFFHLKVCGAAALLASGYCDTVDGTLAREKKLQTPFGAFADIVADRAVETSVIIGLYLYDPSNRGLASLALMGSSFLCVTTFLTVGIFTQNQTEKGFHYSRGLMERGEAFCFFLLMILFPSIFLPLTVLYVILVTFTTLHRFVTFKNHEKK